MFTGTYYGMIDDKNRFRLNKNHKQYLPVNESCYITLSTDGHLVILTRQSLENAIQKIRDEIGDIEVRDNAIRRLTAMCVEIKEDSQGRHTLPKELKQIAGVKKDIAMLGVVDRIEIWNKGEWYNEINN